MEGNNPDAGRGGAQQSVWIVLAALGVVAAAALLWLGRPDWAFVAAALGVVAWFLNMRGQLHRGNAERDAARAGDAEEDDDDDEERI